MSAAPIVFKSPLEYFALRLGDLAATSPGTIVVFRWAAVPRGWKRVGDERAQIETAPLIHHGRPLLTPRGLTAHITATLKLDGVTPIAGVLLDRYGSRDALRIFGNPFEAPEWTEGDEADFQDGRVGAALTYEDRLRRDRVSAACREEEAKRRNEDRVMEEWKSRKAGRDDE